MWLFAYFNSDPVCVCDEKPALEIHNTSSTPSQSNTVQVFLQVGLQSSEECICCPNVTLGYRYCAWSKGSSVPKNISSESSDSLPWSSWIEDNPLCIRKPDTISIPNLPNSHFYKFQVAPLSTKLGPTTKLMYFGAQGITSTPLQLTMLVGVEFSVCVHWCNIQGDLCPLLYTITRVALPVIETIEPKKVQVNDSLSITCKATGSPAPEVYWSAPISCHFVNQMSNILQFEHIQPYQACTYTCFASNWQLRRGTLVLVAKRMEVNIQVIEAGKLHMFYVHTQC